MIPDTQVEMQMHFSERQHVGGVARVSVKTEALDPRRASQPMSSSWPRPDLSRQYEDSKTQISTLLFGRRDVQVAVDCYQPMLREKCSGMNLPLPNPIEE